MEFVVGQRWVSHAEPDLGIGIIIEVYHRRVSISFPAAEDTRTYASDNAPLTRIKYCVGDTIEDSDGNQLQVSDIDDLDGLITYIGEDSEGNEKALCEIRLSSFARHTTPVQRLLNGQVDKNCEFELRIKTIQHTNRLQQSNIRGLLGSRTSLLAHQIYIAHEVAQRDAPRVLLADEVGLGKTIEAGMILHSQVISGKANRILIIVPESLIHQWLVEMLRRFNLPFSIFDQSRLDAETNVDVDLEADAEFEENESVQNPFETEQRIICSLDFLMQRSDLHSDLLAAEWDIVVIDEAHHLHWSQDKEGADYTLCKQLSEVSKGLLLLTATPEQAGIDSHFGRLKLLDPARFHDLDTFKLEEDNYQKVTAAINELLIDGDSLSAQQKKDLREQFDIDFSQNCEDIISQLLDRHGTGRVLFRNVRTEEQGFPQRELHSYPLVRPDFYLPTSESGDVMDEKLYPEITLETEEWLKHDPRVQWLIDKIKELKKQKILVICHNAETAVEMDKYFNLNVGIRSTSFFEGLTILERDRAAAYFAETDGGAQVMICSEIGSEGRNFQFASHLILFDLPLNPDLIEQRIGRLDRIGQKETIKIHVPYIQETAQEVIFRWYNEGLNLFESSCSSGYAIYEKFADQLQQQLALNDDKLDDLISATKTVLADTQQKLDNGRDRLLELNSCRPSIANSLIEQIAFEDDCEILPEYMTEIFDQYGVDHEHHSENAVIIRPSNHMQNHHFPYLKDDGNTITFKRENALIREDMEYLSWEHPMVNESMEMILTSEHGNAAVSTISVKALPPGSILLETWYTSDAIAPRSLQLSNYLPLSPVRVLVGITGKDLSSLIDHEKLNELCEPVKKKIARAVSQKVRNEIETLFKQSKVIAEKHIPIIKQHAFEELSSLSFESERLKALKSVNPAIRSEEIEILETRYLACKEHIDRVGMQLQAARLIVNK